MVYIDWEIPIIQLGGKMSGMHDAFFLEQMRILKEEKFTSVEELKIKKKKSK
jgi:hypothetical protein